MQSLKVFIPNGRYRELAAKISRREVEVCSAGSGKLNGVNLLNCKAQASLGKAVWTECPELRCSIQAEKFG